MYYLGQPDVKVVLNGQVLSKTFAEIELGAESVFYLLLTKI